MTHSRELKKKIIDRPTTPSIALHKSLISMLVVESLITTDIVVEDSTLLVDTKMPIMTYI